MYLEFTHQLRCHRHLSPPSPLRPSATSIAKFYTKLTLNLITKQIISYISILFTPRSIFNKANSPLVHFECNAKKAYAKKYARFECIHLRFVKEKNNKVN